MTKKIDAEDRTAARDYVLARLAICRGALASASMAIDEAVLMFLEPSDDKRGEGRSGLLEGIDSAIGDAARAIQAAMPAMEDIDPKEGETDPEDDEEEDDEDEED